MKRNSVWVVEMLNPDTGEYMPTCGVGLNRESGMDQLDMWRQDNPDDKFRLRPYSAESEGK